MTLILLDRTIKGSQSPVKQQSEIVSKNSAGSSQLGCTGADLPGRCVTCQRQLEKKRKRKEQSTLKIN